MTAQNKERNGQLVPTSEESMSSSLIDSVTADRLAAFLLPAMTKICQEGRRFKHQADERVFCSDVVEVRPLRRRGALSSGSSFTSDSSGGSESGLDVAVRGLSGGLMLASQSCLAEVEAPPADHVRFCVIVCVRSCESPRGTVAREASGEARTCSHQCS
jgi:hypothetical protein